MANEKFSQWGTNNSPAQTDTVLSVQNPGTTPQDVQIPISKLMVPANMNMGVVASAIIGTATQSGFNNTSPTALNTTDFPPVTLTVASGQKVFYQGTICVQAQSATTSDGQIYVAADGSTTLPSGSSNNNFIQTTNGTFQGASICLIGEISGLSVGSHVFSLWGQSGAGISLNISRCYVLFMVVNG